MTNFLHLQRNPWRQTGLQFLGANDGRRVVKS